MGICVKPAEMAHLCSMMSRPSAGVTLMTGDSWADLLRPNVWGLDSNCWLGSSVLHIISVCNAQGIFFSHMSEPWVEWLEWLGLAGYPPFKQPCNMISLSFLIAWQSQGRPGFLHGGCSSSDSSYKLSYNLEVP